MLIIGIIVAVIICYMGLWQFRPRFFQILTAFTDQSAILVIFIEHFPLFVPPGCNLANQPALVIEFFFIRQHREGFDSVLH